MKHLKFILFDIIALVVIFDAFICSAIKLLLWNVCSY